MALDFAALDDAIARHLLVAIAEDPVPEASVYMAPTDSPRVALPAVRISRGPVRPSGLKGRTTAIEQAQVWELVALALAEGPYSVQVLDATYTFDAGADPSIADVLTGVALALAGCPDAGVEVDLDLELLRVTAASAGVHLAIKTTPNMSGRVVVDRKSLELRQASEVTFSFSFASKLDPSSPSGAQHAMSRATLFAVGLWSSASLEPLRAAGVAPLRIASGPLDLDEIVDADAETRAVVEVVYSLQVRTSFARPFIETASATGVLE